MITLLVKKGFNYFQSLPKEKALKRGEQIGSLLNLFNYRKKVVLKNLDIAFPEKDKKEKLEILNRFYKYFGTNIVEFGRIPKYVKSEDIENISKIVKGKNILDKYKENGVILLTGHIGYWEVSNIFLSHFGYKLSVLAYRQKNKEINKLIENMRTSLGSEIIYHDQPMRKMLDALKRGRFLTFLADQNALRHRGTFVKFFSLPASTITFPAKLSLKYNIPVIFVYNLLNEKTGKYEIYVEEIDTKDLNKKDYGVLMEKFNRKLEDAIRKVPHQYLWSHKRWKTRPEGEPENIY